MTLIVEANIETARKYRSNLEDRGHKPDTIAIVESDAEALKIIVGKQPPTQVVMHGKIMTCDEAEKELRSRLNELRVA